jgi:signal transduction histidine kinase
MSEQSTAGQSPADLQAELKHRERQIAAIRRISDALFSRLSVDDLIRQTLTVAIEVLNADTGSVQMHEPATDMLVFRYVAAPSDAALIGHATPTSRGISGRVFRTGVSDLAVDVSRSPDFNPAIDTMTGYQTRSALTVPLKRALGPPIGVMQVLNLQDPFNHGDLEVLEVLAAQAATAIENARLAELARRSEIINVIGNVSHDIYNMLTPLETGLLTLQPMLDRLFERLEQIRSRCPEAEWARELAEAAAEVSSDYGWILDQALASNRRVQARTHWIAGAVKGKLPEPVFEEADLNRTAREVVAALTPLAVKQGVELRFDLDDSLPAAPFDPEHMYNALYNLVNNAIPETPAGGSVTVRTRGPQPGDSAVRIEVIDTGRGIEKEVRDRLFTEAAISTKPGGTGLGTRIIKHVVEQHRGSIQVESEVGRGSTFSIRLPLPA